MKDCNNKIFVFSSRPEISNQAYRILSDQYPKEKNNLIATSHKLEDALEKLTVHYREGVHFDVLILDTLIPMKIRQEFMARVNENQANYECIVAAPSSALPPGDIEFIKGIGALLIPDISEITLLPLLPHVIDRKFNETKYLLVNRIDNIINSEIEGKEVLDRIVTLTLEYLDLRICWIALLDHKTDRFHIGAVTGFGEHEREFRLNFNVSVNDTAVIAECARNRSQVQYQNILDNKCPFKYKELARKMGLKSILTTPIFDRREKSSRKVLGTLSLYSRFYHIFQDDELELNKIIAAKITAALFCKNLFPPFQGHSLDIKP